MERRTAQQILNEAREERVGARGKGYRDDKALILMEDLIVLLEAGAEVIRVNTRESSGIYIHRIYYQGHQFIASTDQPFDTSPYKK